MLKHPVTLEETFLATNSHRMDAFSMVAPVGCALGGLLYFSDAAKVLTMGIRFATG